MKYSKNCGEILGYLSKFHSNNQLVIWNDVILYIISLSHTYIWKVKESLRCPFFFCNPRDCCPPGSFIHGILQARILEWVAIPFSRRSSWPRDRILISYSVGRFFTIWVIYIYIYIYMGCPYTYMWVGYWAQAPLGRKYPSECRFFFSWD